MMNYVKTLLLISILFFHRLASEMFGKYFNSNFSEREGEREREREGGGGRERRYFNCNCISLYFYFSNFLIKLFFI